MHDNLHPTSCRVDPSCWAAALEAAALYWHSSLNSLSSNSCSSSLHSSSSSSSSSSSRDKAFKVGAECRLRTQALLGGVPASKADALDPSPARSKVSSVRSSSSSRSSLNRNLSRCSRGLSPGDSRHHRPSRAGGVAAAVPGAAAGAAAASALRAAGRPAGSIWVAAGVAVAGKALSTAAAEAFAAEAPLLVAALRGRPRLATATAGLRRDAAALWGSQCSCRCGSCGRYNAQRIVPPQLRWHRNSCPRLLH